MRLVVIDNYKKLLTMESLEKVNLPESQVVDQTLTPDATVESAVETVVVENTVTPQDEPVKMSDVMNRLRELAASDGEIITPEEVGRLKQQFYSLVNEAMSGQRDEFVAAGNDPEAFNPVPVEEEPEFKELMAKVKEVKAGYRERIEAQQLRNLERKNAVIDELLKMAEDTDNVNRLYPRAKELQAEFKEIGEVPQQNTTQIWKSFQEAVERFYDQWKVNKELRDYDFKKNLSEKQLLIDEAKALVGEEDVVVAFRRLQELHEKWRETGPVAKELRENIWQEFKDSSAEINKRYQAFFEERKQREQENEAAKTAICERIESIKPEELSSYSAWNKATDTIMEAQKEWKTLGYASRKANNLLFSRFRATCDAFFAAKGEFFKAMKNNLADNLDAKTALCEQAEALADSTDWRKTSDELVELQKKWRTIGAVPKKYSDAIWQRFMTACNTFFDNKKRATTDTRRTEQANLKVKKSVVAELTALNSPDAAVERQEAIAKINELRATWQNTGHIPYRDKDKLHDTYREVVRQLFDKYDIHEKRQRMDSFQNSIDSISSDRGKLLRERDRLMRAYEGRKSELSTYENNLSFLSARSRSGASMLGEIERNIERLKTSIKELEDKIKMIDNKLA